MGIVQNGNVLEAGKMAAANGQPFTGAIVDKRVIYTAKNPNIGKVWRSYNAGITGYWTSVTYGNGIYVAVSKQNMAPNNCCIMSSPDGVTWTPRFWTQTRYQTIIFAHGAFFTMNYGQPTLIYKSVDGINWSSIPSTTSFIKLRSSYCNGLLFMLSGQGSASIGKSIIVSPDGVTWAEASHPLKYISSIAYGGGIYVGACGDPNSSSATITSTNGYNWAVGNMGANAAKWESIAYGNGIFVMSNITNKKLMRSSDGINWIYYDGPATSQGDVVFSNGMFVMADKNFPSGVQVSTDGVNWTKYFYPSGTPLIYEIQAIWDDQIVGINAHTNEKNFVVTP